jgi:mRNA-degrading endonuclease YafQ of YafQ-DinJ toxin-antitoxin module
MLKINTIPLFDKIYKSYKKKYKNIENDLKKLIKELQDNPEK